MPDEKEDRLAHAAGRYLGKGEADLSERERTILTEAIGRRALSRDPRAEFDEKLTVGERLADSVARLGGSWGFIAAFGLVLAAWTTLNLLLAGAAFDPYPFIFLNLLLSMLAAIQAPVIMMSQNRQAAKDREVSAHDYEINLKAEIEIMALHEKLDAMRSAELRELVDQQARQIELLTTLIERGAGGRIES